jgi:hypothetical protein
MQVRGLYRCPHNIYVVYMSFRNTIDYDLRSSSIPPRRTDPVRDIWYTVSPVQKYAGTSIRIVMSK